MSTAGNLARVILVLGSLISAFGMAGTSGAGLYSGGFCWAPPDRSAIVIAGNAIHNARKGSRRNMVDSSGFMQEPPRSVPLHLLVFRIPQGANHVARRHEAHSALAVVIGPHRFRCIAAPTLEVGIIEPVLINAASQ